MLYFAYPNAHLEPPVGNYKTLDFCLGTGWNNEILAPHYRNPAEFATFCQSLEFPPSKIVPTSEEAVLAAGMANTVMGLPGISLRTALLCTDRYMQRSILPSVYSPQWGPVGTKIFYGSRVVKAPASTSSLGVEILHKGEHEPFIEMLVRRRAAEEVSRVKLAGGSDIAIVEQFMKGEHYELSGIVDCYGTVCHYFECLKQEWINGKIKRYERAATKQNELISIAKQILPAFEMQSCAFCIEFIGPPWKVVEVHCRLGEDPGYYDLLADGESPSQMLYDMLN